MRIHLLANVHRTDAVEAAAKAGKWLRKRHVSVAAEPETAIVAHVDPVSLEEFHDANLVVTFGGDGTLIRAAQLCSEVGTPILGVYYGRFGFVTQCVGDELGACLSNFFDGNGVVEPRMMLQSELLRSGTVIATVHSLNEMVLQRAVTVRMMTFEVTVDGHQLTRYPADGVMVSTSTGSTAYNLSAGGPILDPGVQALVLTAIAPHTLSSRTLVLKPNSEIHFKVSTDGDAVLSADGQSRLHLLSQDEVLVKRSNRVTNLLCVEKDDFLIKLGERLFWGQSLHGSPL